MSKDDYVLPGRNVETVDENKKDHQVEKTKIKREYRGDGKPLILLTYRRKYADVKLVLNENEIEDETLKEIVRLFNHYTKSSLNNESHKESRHKPYYSPIPESGESLATEILWSHAQRLSEDLSKLLQEREII